MNGEIIECPKQLSEEFNSCFNRTPNPLVTLNQTTEVSNLPSRDPASLFMDLTDEYEIVDIISSTKASNSAGLDEVGLNLLKKLSDLLPRPMSEIYKKSLEKRIFFE